MDLVFFFFRILPLHITHYRSYIRTFLFIRDGQFFFSGYRAKGFLPLMKNLHFYYYYFVNNCESWGRSPNIRDDEKWE